MEGRKIVIGITGSIAVYKSAFLVRLFVKNGWSVRVIMSESATKFVSPLTFATLSQSNVLVDLWEERIESSSTLWTKHIELAEWSDVLLIAPATANTIAKIANGFCDNFITAVSLSYEKGNKYIAPAMDKGMWNNPATQRNIKTLIQDNWKIIYPEEGFLASGLYGTGRMKEPEEIFNIVSRASTLLEGKRVLITGGPTREFIDPVRFISNRSTGKMGVALANASYKAGAKTTLILGPTNINVPEYIEVIRITSAEDMFNAVKNIYKDYDIIIMSSAVADFTPASMEKEKIKKSGRKSLILELRATNDILKFLGENKLPHQYLVGFALESSRDEKLALEKLKKKNADMIVFNSLSERGAGFEYDTNKVIIFTNKGERVELPLMSKQLVAERIIELIAKYIS